MLDFFKNIDLNINLFDLLIIIIIIFFIVQCFLKGFSLSLISFMKWILSTIITIILVPKLQPIVGSYIESEFINNVGLGIAVFFITLFILILVGKTFNKAITWTGVGSIDKSFGFLFGIFKGYLVAVCIFSIFNWFYPYQNWGISVDKSFSFKFINNGSKVLIDEFPSSDDFLDTKEKIEKI